MTTLYIDAFSGISGDMFIGALLDLGLDIENFKKELGKLNLSGYSIYYEKKYKNSIFGSDFDVILNHGEKDCGLTKEHNHVHGRNFLEIKDLIEKSSLSNYVKKHSIEVFHEIAKSESVVHNKPIKEIHFHEVGAIDSIIDIVGSFIALEMLHISNIISSPLTDGCGTTKVAHGEMPIPVPAVMQMRVNSSIPIHQNLNIPFELVTPTGMGIIKIIVSKFTSIPENLEITKIGYGFGKKETGGFNSLRVLLLKKNL